MLQGAICMQLQSWGLGPPPLFCCVLYVRVLAGESSHVEAGA